MLLFFVLVVTSGSFAYGYANSSSVLSVTAINADFAEVTVDSSSPPAWNVKGGYLGTTGSGSLFEVSTVSSNYTGDLAITITLANTAELQKVYKSLVLRIFSQFRRGETADINEDGIADDKDFVILSLDNASTKLYLRQSIPDRYSIKLAGGWYKSNPYNSGWLPDYQAPQLYCEIAQR